MRTVKNACQLQPNALEIYVGDQIEQLDQIIQATDGREYFSKTFLTEGMKTLLYKGLARLAGKVNDYVFHLKQAMGGGKTHLMVGFGLLAKDQALRSQIVSEIPYHNSFNSAKVAAFNGRNNPPTYLWGEIARQLGKDALFRQFWESGVKAPDESAWLQVFEGEEPVLILLDEMPPYFHYYSTQVLGQGTVADVITRAFANMLTAAAKKKNVCIVVSDLEAAYDTGGRLIQKALDDATQELGRAEISVTPVNLESNEIYEILRKRLFTQLPDKSEIADLAGVYATRLSEAAKAKTVDRSAESISNEIEATYPFHPSFKSIVALFKENEKFKQTRGLMELVSRLLKSVWKSTDDVYLIGAQHFDLSILEVREKLAEISEMRDVIAKDLWDSTQSAHAQIIDASLGQKLAQHVGTLILTASLSTAVNSVKGLALAELVGYLIDPIKQPSDFKKAFLELEKTAWYMHQTQEGRSYFDHQENLTKKLQGYAEKAPQNKVDDLIRHRLTEMYEPTTKEAYEKVLPLPEMDEASTVLKTSRALLIISPDGKVPPQVVKQFFSGLVNKNNLLVLTGEKSQMANVEKAARHVYAVSKADPEISATHPQRLELDERKAQYENDFQSTVLNVFDKLLFPGQQQNEEILRSKVLDSTYPSNEPFNGERQVIKTLTADPIKLYTNVQDNFDTLRARAEQVLFWSTTEVRKTDLIERMRQSVQMPWLPPKGLDLLLQEACQRGAWEDLGNNLYSKSPKPKTTSVSIFKENEDKDSGEVSLRVETHNAGQAPRIYYQEDGPVTFSSSILSENPLKTRALRVQFQVVDPTQKNPTGPAYTWENELTIRNNLDDKTRKVELMVVPKGSMRFTLDGSEPRNGMLYEKPIQLPDTAQKVYVLAECDGLEAKRTFDFPPSGRTKVDILNDKPAKIVAQAPKRLDSSAATYDGLKLAKERGITFENITLRMGSSPQVINLSLGEMSLTAEILESVLNFLRPLVSLDAQVVFSFKTAKFASGYDLEQFSKTLGLDLENEEVVQDE